MSCQCHQIGGPFIAEDPDCPKHGIYAVQLRDRARKLIDSILDETTEEVIFKYASQLSSILEEI
jgi:hypothetical protein